MSEYKARYNVTIPNEYANLNEYAVTLAGILACHPQGQDLYRVFVAVYEKTRADCRDKEIIQSGNYQRIGPDLQAEIKAADELARVEAGLK